MHSVFIWLPHTFNLLQNPRQNHEMYIMDIWWTGQQWVWSAWCIGGRRGWQWRIDCLRDFAADTQPNTLASDFRAYGIMGSDSTCCSKDHRYMFTLCLGYAMRSMLKSQLVNMEFCKHGLGLADSWIAIQPKARFEHYY